MSVALSNVLRRTVARAFPAGRTSAITQLQDQAQSLTQSPLNYRRASLQHAPAATSPLVPKEHLKIPVPDDCQVLQLPDGRLMSYGEYGAKAPDAHPFIFIHGIPDCRLDAALLKSDRALAETLNIRWIGIDRPGMGFSTAQPGRTVQGWVDDLRHLIDHLNLDRYHILSVSGGTGYGLAAAKLLPREQVRGVGVLIGVAPWEAGLSGLSMANKLGMSVWKYFPGAFRFFHDRWIVPIMHQESPDAAVDMFRKTRKYLRKEDLPAVDTEESLQGFAKIFREAFRQGTDGVVQDSQTATEHWGFEVQDVDYPRVRLFYGSEDVNTPPHFGKWMAQRLPDAIYKEYEGKSHFTMWDNIEDVLTDMLKDK